MILRNRRLARITLLGLALGFAILAGLGWVGSVTTQRAVAEIRSAAKITSTWDQTLVLVVSEDELMNDYLRAPDEQGLEPLTSAIGSANANLAWLARHGSPANAAQVTLVGATYETFTTVLRSMVATGSHDPEQLRAEAAEASLTNASLRKQMTVGLQLEHIRLDQDVARVAQRNRRLQNATFVVLGVDLALLLFFANLLLGYQRRLEQHAEHSHHRSQHDPLTGLANRALFEERLQHLVPLASVVEPVALLGLDLDGFKGVNDRYGHHCGDLLLKTVADRLLGVMRRTDVVARLGGDEFAILVAHATVDQVHALAGRIRAAIADPVDLEGFTVHIGSSIGIAVAPLHGTDPGQLSRQADAAMYAAKRGKLGVVMYSESLRAPDPADRLDQVPAPAVPDRQS